MSQNNALKPIYRSVGLDVSQLIERELPMLSAFFHDPKEMHKDVQDWMDFYIKNRDNLPLYELDESCADRAMDTLTAYYQMLKEALSQVFRLANEDLRLWFDCEAARLNSAAFSTFCQLAKATWSEASHSDKSRLTAYGRFDAAMDPVTGNIMGVYELNGDTPVMLFESVNLQNLICEHLGAVERQANDWWESTARALQSYKGKTVAVVFDPGYIEDAATCETIAQMFEHVGARAYMTTPDGLNHSMIGLEKPFIIDGVTARPDGIFILMPWEEMIGSGQDILCHWKSWYQNVRFFEPPWRWFLSHKGMMAFVTHLFETDSEFAARWAHLPHLRTYLTAEPFEREGSAYVSKPVVGRLSQNITIVKPGEASAQTPGHYAEETMVFQEYIAPSSTPGRGNFIACGWLAGEQVKTLAFREFDHDVLELSNERFVAHILA